MTINKFSKRKILNATVNVFWLFHSIRCLSYYQLPILVSFRPEEKFSPILTCSPSARSPQKRGWPPLWARGGYGGERGGERQRAHGGTDQPAVMLTSTSSRWTKSTMANHLSMKKASLPIIFHFRLQWCDYDTVPGPVPLCCLARGSPSQDWTQSALY